jgi:hypothetical protein
MCVREENEILFDHFVLLPPCSSCGSIFARLCIDKPDAGVRIVKREDNL